MSTPHARAFALAKRSQVVQQQIEQERATQADLQRAIDDLHRQEQESTMQEPSLQQQQPHQPLDQGILQQQWRQTQGSVDSKCPLANILQLASWPPQYRAAPLLKYYEESNPQKLLISYEAMIVSSGGDDTTLTKSFIISLENAATNWYARLPPRSIASWAHLKEKFLVNLQGF
jgi:hypothetical protein